MVKNYLKCYTGLNDDQILTLNLKDTTLYGIDKYTSSYENSDELKEDFEICFPKIQSPFIKHGNFSIERVEEKTVKSLDVVYKDEEITQILQYIKVKENTDEIEDTMMLRMYISSQFMRFGNDNIQNLLEEGKLDALTFQKILEFKDTSTKSKQARDLRSENKTLNYYYLRDFVVTINKYLNLKDEKENHHIK